MSEVPVYPWQEKQWLSLTGCVEKQSLAHALLLCGPAAVGKYDFASQLSNYVVCRHRNHDNHLPCHQCKDCLLFQSGMHPDIVTVVPEDSSRQIRIQQIRNIIHFTACCSNQGGYRVVIIKPADAMNIYAANALLKSLEEPGKNTLILLISSRPENLLPTVRSRCQQVVFSTPSRASVLPWMKKQLPGSSEPDICAALDLAHGRPLEAIQFIENNVFEQLTLLRQGLMDVSNGVSSPVEISRKWCSLNTLFIFEWLSLYLAAMIRCRMTQERKYLMPLLVEDQFYRIVRHCTASNFMVFHDWLVNHYSQLAAQVNFNVQLLYETLLIRWKGISGSTDCMENKNETGQQ